MVRKLDPNQCSWTDIRCPNCHSANVIKLETKSGCVDCKLPEIARDCEISACPNSIYWYLLRLSSKVSYVEHVAINGQKLEE